MSSRRQYDRGPSAYKRRGEPEFPPSGKSFLIVTEGQKTEPIYFKQLRERLRLNATDVHVEPGRGTDPANLIKTAIALREKREGRDGPVPYDEVWVVFDLEGPHHPRRAQAKKAIQSKDAAGINFAISDPCFEFWLVLHEEYTTRSFPDCDAVVALIKSKYWKYIKSDPVPKSTFYKLPTAVIHSEKCRKHHHDSHGDGNPSTQIDLLARVLNMAARHDFRFPLKCQY